MDTLTHGLFGLSIAALYLRKPRSLLDPNNRAVVLACVLAAELPDLDYLLPASDPVLVTLRAHRGLSHSLFASPLVAAIPAFMAKAVYRQAHIGRVYLQALVAVILGHLLPDLWTGWGTRLLLPWSSTRLTLDWTMVVDPLVTLPMLIAAIVAFRRRQTDFKKPLWFGLAAVVLYLGLRVGLRESLRPALESRYGSNEVHVFPAPLRVLQWRYVIEEPDTYIVGTATVGGTSTEQGRFTRNVALPDHIRNQAVVAEVLAWARYPAIDLVTHSTGESTLTVADLRYHASGQPTLKFIVELDASGTVTSAKMDRGGSARELVERFRR